MAVTEQDQNELRLLIREEIGKWRDQLLQELTVTLSELVNEKGPRLSREEIEKIVADTVTDPVPALTEDDVLGLIRREIPEPAEPVAVLSEDDVERIAQRVIPAPDDTRVRNLEEKVGELPQVIPTSEELSDTKADVLRLGSAVRQLAALSGLSRVVDQAWRE